MVSCNLSVIHSGRHLELAILLCFALVSAINMAQQLIIIMKLKTGCNSGLQLLTSCCSQNIFLGRILKIYGSSFEILSPPKGTFISCNTHLTVNHHLVDNHTYMKSGSSVDCMVSGVNGDLA